MSVRKRERVSTSRNKALGNGRLFLRHKVHKATTDMLTRSPLGVGIEMQTKSLIASQRSQETYSKKAAIPTIRKVVFFTVIRKSNQFYFR